MKGMDGEVCEKGNHNCEAVCKDWCVLMQVDLCDCVVVAHRHFVVGFRWESWREGREGTLGDNFGTIDVWKYFLRT